MRHDVHLHYFLRPDHWEIADLWVANWRPGMPELGFNARHDWLFEHLEALHEAGGATICAVNTRTGGIAGFITLNPDSGRIDQIVVASTARGQGIGSRLVEAAKSRAKVPLAVSLDADDARAAAFFDKAGFARVGAAGGRVEMRASS